MASAESQSAEQPTHARFVLSVWLAGAAATAYLCRNSFGVMESTIRADLGISKETMGLIMGPVFFWSYAAAQIPGGWLTERFGARRVLPVLSAAWSLAAAVAGLAHGVVLLIVSRVSGGLAQAGLFPGAMHSASRWYPSSERAFISGVLGAAMQIGAVFAGFLTGKLLGVWDWPTIFAVYALFGLAWSAGFYRWFRNDPASHSGVNAAELDLIRAGRAEETNKAEPTHARVPWAKLAASPRMWLVCAQQFCSAGGLVFFGSWFSTYLQETRDVSVKEAASLTAAPPIAGIVACFVCAGVSDWILRVTGSRSHARRSLAMGSYFLCSLLFFAAYFISNATAAAAVISVGVFFAAFGGPCAYATTIDMGGRHVAAVFSTMNMFGNLGAGLMPAVVPYFLKFIDNRPTLESFFGGNSWNAVVLLFGGMYVMASFFWLLLNTEGSVFDDTRDISPAEAK